MAVDVTVVIPTYRRPDLLRRCLDALARQVYPAARFEVIVVDDATDEETRRLVTKRAQNLPLTILYLCSAARGGPARARNLGWRASSAEFIAFTDDDCLPDPHWLERGVDAMQSEADAVTGRIEMPLPPVPTDYELDAAGLERGEFVTANCFCRRSALQAIGGFDERFLAAWREDSDLQFSLLRHGCRIVRESRAVVVHPVRSARWGVSVLQLPKTQFNALLFKKHPAMYRARIERFPRSYLAINAALLVSIVSAVALQLAGLTIGAVCWAIFTANLCRRRLARTSRSPSHVAEMVVTSIIVPPLSFYWHCRGLFRFRTFFL